MRSKHGFTLLFAILIIALAANTASVKRYTYHSGGEYTHYTDFH